MLINKLYNFCGYRFALLYTGISRNTFFDKKNVHKKMRLKRPKSLENHKQNITRFS